MSMNFKMESQFLQPNGETLQRMIQGYVRASKSKMLKNQLMDEKVLISELMMHMENFLEQDKAHTHKIIDAEQNYQKLLQEREAFRKQIVDQRKKFFECLKQYYDEFFKGLNDMEQRHLKQYIAAYNVVCKDTQEKFQQLFEMQQQELTQLKKKIFSLLM